MSVLGNTGAEGNPEFSPLGDSVNVAFRLESATKGSGFDVALGQKTFTCLRDIPGAQSFFEMRQVALKGYKDPVEAWLTSFESLERFLENSNHGS
jgi:adenylate cyclase